MCRLSRNLGASTSWKPQGLSRSVMKLLLPWLLSLKTEAASSSETLVHSTKIHCVTFQLTVILKLQQWRLGIHTGITRLVGLLGPHTHTVYARIYTFFPPDCLATHCTNTTHSTNWSSLACRMLPTVQISTKLRPSSHCHTNIFARNMMQYFLIKALLIKNGCLNWITKIILEKVKSKVIPLEARCGPQGVYRYSSTLPWPRH